MSSKVKATRADTTKARYLHRSKLLCIKALKEAKKLSINTTGHTALYEIGGEKHEGLTLSATASWAAQQWREKYAKSTWRQYRSALCYAAEVALFNGTLESSEVVEKIARVLAGENGAKKQTLATSASKLKHIKDEDLTALLNYLKESRSKVAGFLSVWLYVNCLVGLRPSEWATSALVDENTLRVMNAKATNGRSHGEYRDIDLTCFTPMQIERVKEFATLCITLQNRGMFDTHYETSRKLLNRACRKLWPSRKRQITLYSTRHQFSADLKKNGRGLEEIAYLMGHYSTDTATSHYGKRRHGRSKMTPTVPESKLGGIAKKHRTFTFNPRRTKAL